MRQILLISAQHNMNEKRVNLTKADIPYKYQAIILIF